MIIAISIVAGVIASLLSYRVLFYDSDDFWDECGKCTVGLLTRPPRRMWRGPDPLPPEHFEDESWSSGVRFLLFVVASAGLAYLAYYQLHKHFG
jgi:hypothetical protein